MVELLSISIVGASGGFIGAPVFSWLHVTATGGFMWAPEFSCLHLELIKLHWSTSAFVMSCSSYHLIFHDDRLQVRNLPLSFAKFDDETSYEFGNARRMNPLCFTQRFGVWSSWDSSLHAPGGIAEVPCTIFELRTLTDFQRGYGFRSALDDIFGAPDERVLADRNCWWIRSSGRDCSRIRLLDILDSIL